MNDVPAPSERAPAVAGAFYPGAAAEVAAWIAPADPVVDPVAARGALVPHAGWVYSGALAREVLGGVRVPRHVLVAGPNHTGLGPPLSLYPPGRWRFPGFDVAIDAELSVAIAGAAPDVVWDTAAHAREHGVEVVVPFAYGRNPRLELTALVLGRRSAPDCIALGEAIAGVVAARDWTDDFLFVASSDMTHFQPAAVAAERDALVWPHLQALDAAGLHATVVAHGLTMCGFVPTAVMLACARALGATRAERIGYTHSGVTNGDHGHVVAYAGWRFR